MKAVWWHQRALFSVGKDLIVDMQPFFERVNAMRSEKVESKFDDMSEREHTQAIEERKLFDDAVKFFPCTCCVAACPVALRKEPNLIGSATILRAQRYVSIHE